jgi:hypothetical protein
MLLLPSALPDFIKAQMRPIYLFTSCLFMYLFIYVFIYLFVYLFIYLNVTD